jgi:hypothetical protein
LCDPFRSACAPIQVHHRVDEKWRSLAQQNNNSTVEPTAARPNARASNSAANLFDHLTKMTDLANPAPGKFRNVGMKREKTR